jgi:hypothetical protein
VVSVSASGLTSPLATVLPASSTLLSENGAAAMPAAPAGLHVGVRARSRQRRHLTGELLNVSPAGAEAAVSSPLAFSAASAASAAFKDQRNGLIGSGDGTLHETSAAQMHRRRHQRARSHRGRSVSRGRGKSARAMKTR